MTFIVHHELITSNACTFRKTWWTPFCLKWSNFKISNFFENTCIINGDWFFQIIFRWRTCCWNSMFNWLVFFVMSSTQTLRYLIHFLHHHLSWSCNIMCRCMDYIFQCRFLLCCYLGINSTIVLYWNQEWK